MTTTSDVLAELADALPRALLAVDADGTIIAWNSGAEHLLGFDRAEIIGEPETRLIPDDATEAAQDLRRRALSGETVVGVLAKRIHRSGHLVDVLMSATPIQRGGAITGIAIEASPVTSSEGLREFGWLAVSAAPSGMLVADGTGKIVFANLEVKRMFGYKPGQLIGRSVDELVPEAQRGGHAGLRARFSRVPSRRTMGAGRELFGLRLDGSTFPVEVGLTPIESRGEVLVLAVVIDISVRHTMEQRLQLAVEAAPSGFIMVDPNGQIVMLNRATEQLFGYSREELLGKSVETLVPHTLRHGHADLRAGFATRPMRREMSAVRDLVGRRKDGSEVPLEIGLNPVVTADGLFVLASLVDISDRRRFEEELRRTIVELEQFAFVASHDLQEPLRMVAGFTELLEDRYRDRLDDTARKYIRFAADGARRMQQMIRDILSMSRVGQDGEPLAETDVGALVRDVLETRLGAAVAEANAHITCGNLPVVPARARELRLVFQNLIGNAIKFRSPEREPIIHVSAQATDSSWEFSVRDNGIGIEPAFFDKVFKIFQRLHSSAEYSGSGIGLALVRKIVHNHGGQTWIESELGVGTTIHFTLPRLQGPASISRQVRTQPPSPGPTP